MEDNKGKVQIIPFDKLVTIEISGSFYNRLQQLKFAIAAQKPVEEYKKMLEHFQGGGKPRDLYEAQQEMFLSLLFEIENSAQAQNKFVYVAPEDIKKD